MNPVNAAELDRYRVLCDRMRDLASHVGFLAEEGPAIGHRLVVCRDLSMPLSKARWADVIVSNKGSVPNDRATWEDWSEFGDKTAVSHYFGLGESTDVEDVPVVLERGYDLLAEYEDIDELPDELVWDTPWVHRFGSQLPKYEYLLDLICRETGERQSCPGFDELEVIENHDLLRTIADQFQSWVGDRTWVGDPTWLRPGEKPKTEDFTCQFQQVDELWHVGYAVNEGNDNVILPHRVGLERIVRLLKHEQKEFSPLELIGSMKPPERKVEVFTLEAVKRIDKQISKLEDELDGLREVLGDPETVDRIDEIESELSVLKKEQSKMRFQGHTKTYTTDFDRARKSTRKSIDEAFALIAEQSPELAKLLYTDIQYRDGKWCYRPSQAVDWVFDPA